MSKMCCEPAHYQVDKEIPGFISRGLIYGGMWEGYSFENL